MAGGKGRRHPGDLGREALLQGAGVCAHDEEGQGRGQRCGSPSRAGPPGGAQATPGSGPRLLATLTAAPQVNKAPFTVTCHFPASET